MKRRIVALLLSVMMVMQCLSINVLADANGAAEDSPVMIFSDEIDFAGEYYTVVFEDDEGNKIVEQYIDTEAEKKVPVVPDEPVKEKHKFVGWVPAEGGPQIELGQPVEGDITYVAKFEELIKYKVILVCR